VDGRGNLYVADSLNSRVLVFKDALTSDTVADAVLGQDRSFRSRLKGTGEKRFGGRDDQTTFDTYGPSGLVLGPGGELYVADTSNDRLLVFENPLADDTADRVFGHSGFGVGGAAITPFDTGPQPTAATFLRPMGLAFDAQGNLYVTDTYDHRVVAFDRP
jgi:DNA-binding beta-propeller fold protein YncE